MVVAAGRRLGEGAIGQSDGDALPLFHMADDRHRRARSACRIFQRSQSLERDCESDFVVVPGTGQAVRQIGIGPRQDTRSRRQRNRLQVDDRPQTGLFGQMADVLNETVGNVERGRRDADQRAASTGDDAAAATEIFEPADPATDPTIPVRRFTAPSSSTRAVKRRS